MFFSIHCTVSPDQAEALDRFLTSEAAPYWRKQKGVRKVTIHGVGQTDWPARTISIEVTDPESLRRIMNSDERRQLKRALSDHVIHSNGSTWMRRVVRRPKRAA